MSKGLHAWPEDRLRRLIELWADQMWTIEAIARDLGVDRHTAIRRAKALGLPGRPLRPCEPWPNELPTSTLSNPRSPRDRLQPRPKAPRPQPSRT